VGGGCINAAYVLEAGQRRFFVKVNGAKELAMFEAEAEGLTALGASDSIRVPQPLCYGVAGTDAYLVMEYLALGGRGKAEHLGEALAAMHRSQQTRFGWHRDNTIGSTPQINDWSADWPGFWRDRRLGAQLTLAAGNGAGTGLLRKGERLQQNLAAFFSDYQPLASLLHGDLWSGNYAFDDSGRPVIFDPAVYYGDRETDLAMTELFGGFPSGFYAAYEAAWPLDVGYSVRKTLYNLYHILNHFNLFGGGYLAQAEGMMDRLLSECR
jgi:fructosamine-3-kinase